MVSIKEELREESLGVIELQKQLFVTDNEGNEKNLIDALQTDIKKMANLLQKNNSDGKITISLKFSNGNDKRIKIVPDLKTQFPKVKKLETTMYSEQGYILTDHPDQLKLDVGARNNVKSLK